MKLGVMLLLQRRIQAPAVMVTNLTEREAIVARLITVKMATGPYRPRFNSENGDRPQRSYSSDRPYRQRFNPNAEKWRPSSAFL